MKKSDLEPIAAAIVTGIKAATDPLTAHVRSIEQRLAALEAKPSVKYCGVWKPGGAYAPGDAATHKGALWICKAATTGEPSKDFVGWQLALRKGGA